MATIFDNKPTTAYAPVQEDAALHNARIKERYEQLKNAEANQLAESISEAEKRPYAAPRASASTLAPERPDRTAYPAYAAPAREEKGAAAWVHTKVDSPLFTPETLDKTLGRETDAFAAAEISFPAPVGLRTAETQRAEAAIAPMPVAAVNIAAREESYGLSAFAVKMIAAFAALVILLLTVIGINSSVIRRQSAKLSALEAEKATLAQRNAQIEQQIEEATSYEKIAEFAKENGWILQEE